MKKTQTPQEYAIKQLYEQLVFMKSGIQQAQENGNMKEYLSIMRVYTPALKEYVRLCRESDIAERADALIDFVNGGV